jgi:putative acyl-CoA dehydrogenase
LDQARGADQRLAAAVAALRQLLASLAKAGPLAAQQSARQLAGLIAVTLQAALLVQYGGGPSADAFCASRLGPGKLAGPAAPFGTLPAGLDLAAIIGPARVTGADRVG